MSGDALAAVGGVTDADRSFASFNADGFGTSSLTMAACQRVCPAAPPDGYALEFCDEVYETDGASGARCGPSTQGWPEGQVPPTGCLDSVECTSAPTGSQSCGD